MTASVLDAITRAALDTTGGADAWLLIPDAEGLRVAAGAGERGRGLVGRRLASVSGTAAMALSSGQPAALRVAGEGVVDPGLVGLLGHRPASILSIPCEADDRPVAVLEVADSASGAFGIDDVEVVTALGAVVAAAVADSELGLSGASPVLTPRLAAAAGRLQALDSVDPARFERAVTILELLLEGTP